MGSTCCKQPARKDATPDHRPNPQQPTRPRTVTSGSRVYIRSQDPSIDLPLKMIHLPQEIRSGDGGGVDAVSNGKKADQRPLSQLSQVAYVPQSFANSDPELGPVHEAHSQNLFKDSLINKVAGIFHYKLGHGPRTDDFVVELLNMKLHEVKPTEGNDYLYDPNTHPAEFDAINTLAVSQLVTNMFRRCTWELGEKKQSTWRWGSEPLTLYPYAAKIKNAFYKTTTDRETPGRIEFGYFSEDGRTKYFCRSFDVIAHEVGHALLDGLKPEMMDEGLLEGFALTEAFADLTAVFGVLYQLDLCQVILRESSFNLNNKTFLSVIGDGYAEGGIRSVDNNLKISDVEAEAHDLALVISGAIYDIIADTFELKQSGQRDIEKDAEILCGIGRHLFGITIVAITRAPDIKIKFRDVTFGMMSLEKDEDIRGIMQRHFEKRELLNLDLTARPRVGHLSLVHGCCETMKMKFETTTPTEPAKPISTILHSDPTELHPHSQNNRPTSGGAPNTIPHRTIVSVDK